MALSASEFAIVTPDDDVYVEQYGGQDDDIEAVRWSAPWNQPPRGVPSNLVYRFRTEPTPDERAAYRQQASVEAAAVCRERALATGQPQLLVNLQPLAPVAGGPAAPGAAFLPPPAGVLRGALPAARPANQEARWRAAHSIGDIRYGDEIAAHVATANAVGDRDIHSLPTGEGVFVERVTPDQEKEFFERVVAADARILAVSRRSGGRREMSWAELVERVRQEDFKDDWTLPGPRTAKWCIEFIHLEGLGPDGHHERFRVITRVEPNQWGVQEHFQLTQIIKLLLLVDQCDGTNLQAAEAIFRRMQTIEYSYMEKVRDREQSGQSARLSLEEQAAFAGTTRGHTSLMVCPELLDYVRKEVEREASLVKNLRKAREEREALRESTKPKK